MPMTLPELRSNREAAKNKILQLRDAITKEDRDFNTEERASWEAANKDFDDLTRRIEVMERGDAVSKLYEGSGTKDNKPGLEDKGPAKRGDKVSREGRDRLAAVAMQGWFARQMGKPITKGHRRAAELVGMNLRDRELVIRLPRRPGETRAQSTSGSAGGYTIPTGFVASLEYALKEFNSVRQVAEIWRTPDGTSLPYPTINDTSNVGTLLAENTQVSEVAATFGQTTFGAYKFTSGLVLVSSELDEDSALDMSSTIGGLLGERIARGTQAYFTTGTGSSQPGGIVTGSTLGKTAASATVIAADEVIDLFHSVDPAYRMRPGAGFMMHDTIAAAIRKLKDSQGQYLWDLQSMRDGEAGVLLGKKVTINQSMQSSIATATKTVLFGDLSAMKVRDAGPIRIRRLVERYADYDQIGFVAFQRVDSKVLNAGTNPIKHLLQA